MRLLRLTSYILILITYPLFSQIYVAPDGSDSNPGTIDKPLESIQKAQELVSAGDTVFIRGGTYKIREDQISKVVSNLFVILRVKVSNRDAFMHSTLKMYKKTRMTFSHKIG